MEEYMTQGEIIWKSIIISGYMVGFYFLFFSYVPKRVSFKKIYLADNIVAMKAMLETLENEKKLLMEYMLKHSEIMDFHGINQKNIVKDLSKVIKVYSDFLKKPNDYYSGKKLVTFFRLVQFESMLCQLSYEIENVKYLDKFFRDITDQTASE
jgi:hypothetical protein